MRQAVKFPHLCAGSYHNLALNYELHIARRMLGNRQKGESRGGSRAIIRIAVAGIAIGMAVMILSVAIVTGFQKEIRSKVIGFGSHLQISNFNPQNTLSVTPMHMDQPFVEELRNEPGVKSLQAFAYKAGIITENGEIQGILAKGITQEFDRTFFEKNLVEGTFFSMQDSVRSDSILLSTYITDRLGLELGDKITIVFIQDEKERKRRFTIGGVFESGMEQFDGSIILCDIRHVQRLNNWDENQVSGYEVILKDFKDLDKLDQFIYEHIGYEFNTQKITDQFMDIFGWLELQDINVIIIISLMVLVSGINMVSALLVLILERTNMIGMLKAMGANNWSIQKIFLYNAAFLILIGLFWGNLFGLGIAFLQHKFQFLKLDKSSYYVDHVPVHFQWDYFLLINAGSLALCMLMLLLPSMLVAKLNPVKTIRFN